MSIPSVHFKAPSRKPGQPKSNAPRPPIGNKRVADRLVTLEFSSEDSSDELPVIQTRKSKHTLIDIADSSSSSEKEVEVTPAKEVDWGSKNPHPANFRPRQPSHSLVRSGRDSSANSDSLPSASDHNHSDSQHSGRRRRRVRRPIQKVIIEEEEDKSDDPPETEIPVHRRAAPSGRQRSRTLEPHPQRPPARNIETFTVVKEVKKSKRGTNADFRMMQNETALFFSKIGKDDIGINYIISKSIPVMPDSPDNVGILRKQCHGKRYTVYGTSEKPFDDRDAEACGFAFVKLPEVKSKQKAFRIAFREDSELYYPVSKRRELSRVAETGEAFANLKTYVNKPPTIGPDGNLINYFGTIFVVDSLKNYIVADENDKPLFMIFKSSEASFTVKAKPPITPLMAFGMSIAIIEDCR
ncbi:hypothetical protein TRFO_16530 [Tritrichomonas foetus]|uniref:Tubby C-terminal domain-containing protein n=1 Tax=Tritrichomonas foetus TaxID=1144522 RepID=A0A1J4KQX0_9EUKA|nr:hypothetical protein TRFO_16530 [Tritrichomonas foetus]|eukprot:OHT13328.1 hypothetical protein TRFO_16530 [Tritrichomonas foetus]